FGTRVNSFTPFFDSVERSRSSYLVRSLTTPRSMAPVRSRLKENRSARKISWPMPANGPYMRGERVFEYSAASCGFEEPSVEYERVIHWKRSNNQANRPPAVP